MTFRIGFAADDSPDQRLAEAALPAQQTQPVPRRSVVQVYFAGRNLTLAYYNDRFDLHCGDMVYVEGKLEGQRGRVTEVNYNFRIRISDYKRVIAVADTAVSGQFFMAGSHLITFDRAALPVSRAAAWFLAPSDGEEIVSGCDDTVFRLDDLSGMKLSPAAAERGRSYYMENRVRYLCLDGARGYALVEGSAAYEVEFDCHGRDISYLVCSCYCGGRCKHELAVMLQLREALSRIEQHYAAEYQRTGYFAAVSMHTLFSFAVDGRESGSLTLA